ncbi:BTB/POZ domain-containing protein 2-like isoform X2 [Cimex lectularius]|uniref:BTB domain-containing protein n=1 Tax=Cimex lectularius TaxID=79782 RepID=A0A8I6SJD6_CIMLE|nr:BTB/POZ domain-containing protein 2-like isoform X2 [Cimex lectularius]
MAKPKPAVGDDWRNTNQTWEEKMMHIFRCNYGSDITIKICEDKNETSFKAHRFVLSMSSEVFDAMLKAPVFKNPGDAVLMLMNVNAAAFGLFLEYIYCKTLQFKSIKEAIGVYKIADKFNITELKNTCVNYLDEHFSIENVMECVEFADAYRLEGLKQRCVEIIQHNTGTILNESNSHTWKIEWLMLVLDQPALSIPEPELFRMITVWLNNCNAENECAKSKAQACLLPKFCFMNFKGEEFVAGPVKSGLLTKNQSLAILGHIVADENCHLDYPEGFSKNVRNLLKEVGDRKSRSKSKEKKESIHREKSEERKSVEAT